MLDLELCYLNYNKMREKLVCDLGASVSHQDVVDAIVGPLMKEIIKLHEQLGNMKLIEDDFDGTPFYHSIKKATNHRRWKGGIKR